MPETKPACLVCAQTSAEIPLIAISFQGSQYWICPSHFPILIHQPNLLVGKLPGAPWTEALALAEQIQPHPHD